ncbi:MAG: outer membrane protein assembly factor BamD [Proteobacteria bacterium]|nr:outer membrane protein assembly factor BamD [Pseudomonadota bacterium]
MRKPALLLLLALLGLAGCSSNSKDEKYNNMSPNEIYQEGVKHVKKKRFDQAIEDFEALESRYPFGEYADKAQLGAIYSYYENEDYASATPAIDRFLRMYPRHPSVDYAYYMKGLTHYSESSGFLTNYLPVNKADRDTGPLKKSYQAFHVLVTRFPESIYVNDAKQRMVYLRNILAENELVAARFYMKKGAYLAAANRASNVIVQFERAPVTAEALFIMVQAYRKLELNTLANDAYRVLAFNYPDSDYLKELG